MNITEANHVVSLVRLLDGSTAGQDVDQLLEAVTRLAERASKPLLLTVRVDVDQARANITDLFARRALATEATR